MNMNKRNEDKTVQELKDEISLMDNMLDYLKQERNRKLDLKKKELEDRYEETLHEEKTQKEIRRQLVEYKQELNEDLDINQVRTSRSQLVELKNQKEAEEISQEEATA